MSLLVLAAPGAPAGQPVREATLTLPREGAWHIDLQLEATVAPAGRFDLLMVGHRLSGTVVRARMVEGVARVRMAAGAAGLRRPVAKRHYTAPTVRNVLAALAGNVGEIVSATADPTLLGVVLEHWTTVAMPAGAAIRVLLDRVPEAMAPEGVAWRLLPDGSIWVGQETWPDSEQDAIVVGEASEDGRVELALEVPFLLPGTTIGEFRIDQVEIRATGDDLRTTIWTAPS